MIKHLLCIFTGVLIMSQAIAKEFVLESTSLDPNQSVPTLYTCEGKDISPQLSWKNFPEKTQSFALIFSDPDAPSGTFYHWILYNLPSSVTELKENYSPNAENAGKNTWGKTTYGGPCPPKGSTHRYFFTLYALDSMLSLSSHADIAELSRAMEGHILGMAVLSATFGR